MENPIRQVLFSSYGLDLMLFLFQRILRWMLFSYQGAHLFLG